MARRRPARNVGLGVFALAMINVAAVISARNLPLMAEYGWSMLALYGLAIVAFLIPISLAISELGTAWPGDGGLYAWVREAFGGRTGFLAVWAEYAQNIVWYPTALSFMAASFAYVIDPDLATNKVFLIVVMLTFFWGITLANLPGVSMSAAIGTVGTIAGSILPAALVVLLGVLFLAQGHHSEIPFSGHALVPEIQVNNLAFLGGIILTFTGMEMAGFHARETPNPGRDIPRSIALAFAVIVLFSVLGSLFLAFVVPQKELSLVSGTMQLFKSVLDKLSVGWLLKPLAFVVAAGGVAHLAPWILGPPKGVAAVARDGYAPPRLARTNANNVPVALLIIEAIGGTLFTLLFLVIPDVSTSYWMLSAVTSQIIIVMYVLMFGAVIRLRYSQPDRVRPYRIPGGMFGVWVAAGVGLVGCLFSFYLGFIPPSQLKTGNHTVYVLLLVGAVVVLSLPPFLYQAWQRLRGQGPQLAPATL